MNNEQRNGESYADYLLRRKSELTEEINKLDLVPKAKGLCELTDEELGRCISQCHENFLNSESAEEANAWRWAMTALLSEQRRRMDLMLKEAYDDNPWDYRCRQVMACYGEEE